MTKSKRNHTPRPGAIKALRAIRRYAKENSLSARQLADVSGIDYKTCWLWLSYSSAEAHTLTENSETIINMFLDDVADGKVRLDGEEPAPKRPLEVQEELELSTPEFEEAANDETLILRRKLKEQEVLLEAYRTGRIV